MKMRDIGYTSDNGYTGYLYGKSSISILNPEGEEVMHTSSRKINTEEELIEVVERYGKSSRRLQHDRRRAQRDNDGNRWVDRSGKNDSGGRVMNKFFCKITGGHRYKSGNLETWKSEHEKIVHFKNICEKCGEVSQWEIPEANLYPEKYREILKL